MALVKSAVDLIGNTPLVQLINYKEKQNLKANIYAKVEFFNPGGSIKDRIAHAMLEEALSSKKISRSTTIIEATSGNTGIGLALICACYDMKLILTMPETMSIERRKLLSAYGAKIILTEGKLGMTGAITKANELKAELGDAFIPSQFDNPNNPQRHYQTTAKELWNDLDGNIDILVAGVGTGGTITGIGTFLKEKNPHIKVIAVEPYDSQVLTKGTAGPHGIQGIGAGFVPSILNTSIIDEIMVVKTEEAYQESRLLAKQEGLLVGISSGAALAAAKQLSQRLENSDKNIVVILPDTGERYLSTQLFE